MYTGYYEGFFVSEAYLESVGDWLGRPGKIHFVICDLFIFSILWGAY